MSFSTWVNWMWIIINKLQIACLNMNLSKFYDKSFIITQLTSYLNARKYYFCFGIFFSYFLNLIRVSHPVGEEGSYRLYSILHYSFYEMSVLETRSVWANMPCLVMFGKSQVEYWNRLYPKPWFSKLTL